jgi:hypothetical protein
MDTDGHGFFLLQNIVDIRRRSVKFVAIAMKCEMTNVILTFVLGVLVVLGVVFALKTVNRTREVRQLQVQMVNVQRSVNILNLLLNDAVQYGKTHPDINPIIQPFETKPAAH